VAAFGPIGLSLQRILSADLTPECRMASLPSAPVKQWPRKALTLACCLSLQLPLLAPWSRQAVAQGLPAPTAPTAPRSLASDNALPALGDINSQSLSPAAERRMGDRIMRSILRDPDVVDDPLVLEHVDQVWSSLLASARQRGEINEELDTTYAWRPFLVREKSVNAFALPGGYIGIHLGLLAMTNTSEEFASVLAHELSHVTQRHIARLISQSRQTSWVSIASMVLGALAMSRNPQAAQAMIIGGQGVAMQGQLNFSRDMEREADRVGFGVMLDAGYDPSGMAQMLPLLAHPPLDHRAHWRGPCPPGLCGFAGRTHRPRRGGGPRGAGLAPGLDVSPLQGADGHPQHRPANLVGRRDGATERHGR